MIQNHAPENKHYNVSINQSVSKYEVTILFFFFSSEVYTHKYNGNRYEENGSCTFTFNSRYLINLAQLLVQDLLDLRVN